ncbi:MAG: GtrA family protein [Proteobacteria bacterium]|nr:GtrA family protein [Pseudomonadota bacterium]
MHATSTRNLVAAGLGGVAATAVDVGTLVLLVEALHAPIPLASFTAALAGATVGFVANKYVAFADRSAITVRQLASFAFVALATALLMALAMKVVAVKLGVPYVLAKLLCAAAIFVGWTYPAQRKLVFKPAASMAQ